MTSEQAGQRPRLAFSFRNFFRFTVRWLASFEWSGRRALIVLAYFVVVPLVELLVWIGLLLDWLLFPGFRRQPVQEPVFVIGNFRSGTTFLHRLLAEDRTRFTTMKMWEILFAPSITQRRLVNALVALDRRLGRPVPRLLERMESRWRQLNVMHEVSLSEPEEDEYLCLHTWSALTIGLSAGLLDEARSYAGFDQQLDASDRRRIMAFYRGCVRRHLYALGPTPIGSTAPTLTYLAKNPALTPKIDSVLEEFPGCRFIYLVRNPLEAIPSFVNMMKFSWEALGAKANMEELSSFVMEMAAHWYRYPLERLAELPPERCRIVVYDELVSDPRQAVTELYQQFGYEIGPEFAACLADVQARSADYRSRHEYDADVLGISEEAVRAEFADVFERFGFGSLRGVL